ncbi:acyl carrier protein [Plantactinospora sp. WMMB334]|uniref:acyl carrier protein n=1 Tax=Plantactinospora sp. WMMB334 TaxID=3404119 RepID=UPI003B943642
MFDPHATVEHQVRTVIANLLHHPVETVDADAGLSDLSGLDSLTLFQILDALEKRFEISLDESELYGASSLADLVKIVELNLAEVAAPSGEPGASGPAGRPDPEGADHERA